MRDLLTRCVLLTADEELAFEAWVMQFGYIAYTSPELSANVNSRIQNLERDQHSQYCSPVLSVCLIGPGESQLLGSAMKNIEMHWNSEMRRKNLFMRHVFYLSMWKLWTLNLRYQFSSANSHTICDRINCTMWWLPAAQLHLSSSCYQPPALLLPHPTATSVLSFSHCFFLL